MLFIVLLFFSVVGGSLLMTLLLRSNAPAKAPRQQQQQQQQQGNVHLQQQQQQEHNPGFFEPHPHSSSFSDFGAIEAREQLLLGRVSRVSQDSTASDAHDSAFLNMKLTNSHGQLLCMDDVREVLQSVSEDQVDECQAMLSSMDYDLDELRELEARLM